jgi:hypothetical protein
MLARYRRWPYSAQGAIVGFVAVVLLGGLNLAEGHTLLGAVFAAIGLALGVRAWRSGRVRNVGTGHRASARA